MGRDLYSMCVGVGGDCVRRRRVYEYRGLSIYIDVCICMALWSMTGRSWKDVETKLYVLLHSRWKTLLVLLVRRREVFCKYDEYKLQQGARICLCL